MKVLVDNRTQKDLKKKSNHGTFCRVIKIFFLCLLILIIGLIVVIILILHYEHVKFQSRYRKKIKKYYKLINKKRNFICSEGYFLGKSYINKNVCIKCSVENCKKCEGEDESELDNNTCVTCFPSYTPIYENNTIISCDLKDINEINASSII